MKLMTFLIVMTLFLEKGFSQYEDTEQPDSIYKLNNVKKRIARYERFGMQNCNVNSYDINGKLINRTMLAKDGKTKWLETIFEYDCFDKLMRVSYNSYMNSDPVTGQDKPDSILDSTKINVSNYQYDSLNRLIKVKGTASPDKTPFEISYYYDPLKTVAKFYKYRDKTITVAITNYETPTIIKTQFSSYDSAVVTKNAWQENYKNFFDESGRIIKRIKETPTSPTWTSEILYEYNDKGLLIKKTEYRSDCNSPNCKWVILFDYEYWDNKPEPFLYTTRVDL